MVKSVFMAVVAVACILLGMVLMVGFSSCSHSSDDFIGDNPDTRYFGISGDGAGNGSSGTGGTSTGSSGGSGTGTGGSGSGSTPAPTPIPPGPAAPAGFVSIPAGTFTKGSGSTAYNVTLTKDFWMCDHEVTQAEYEAVMGSNPSRFTGDDSRPVETVGWLNAIAYCNARSTLEGLTPCYTFTYAYAKCDFTADGYRLPTEAEWEYAARAGLTGSLVWSGTSSSASVGDYAWYKDNSGNTTHPVKTKLPNAWGLYDMTGNVMEFCWDLDVSPSGYYSGDRTDPVYPPANQMHTIGYRVLHGGAYQYTSGNSIVVERYITTHPLSQHGFRVVRTKP